MFGKERLRHSGLAFCQTRRRVRRDASRLVRIEATRSRDVSVAVAFVSPMQCIRAPKWADNTNGSTSIR